MNNNSDKLLQEISVFIVDQLEHEKMTLQLSRKLAKFFLELVPEDISNDEMESLLQKMDEAFFDLLKQEELGKASDYIQNK